MSEVHGVPYKGLIPYLEEDAAFFFGRESEREIITANLLASRLTVLYGASGVGKTSVLRAAVARHLKELTRRNLAENGSPEFVAVVFSSWRDDPVRGLLEGVQNTIFHDLGEHFARSASFSPSLADSLCTYAQSVGGELLIILDQFEEYFLYHPSEEGEGTFSHEFPRAVNHPNLQVNFLVSLREDALGKLDRFKGRIPGLFDNYLRLQHLDREGARAAIEKPIEQYNILQDSLERHVRIEQKLVDTVLQQTEVGKVAVGEIGRGVVKGENLTGPSSAHIETPYLQLVMTRVWEHEMHSNSRVLRLVTFQHLGGATLIAHTHLDVFMKKMGKRERKIAAALFHYLVTPEGSKIALTAKDLAYYTKMRQPEVEKVLGRLSSPTARILHSMVTGHDQHKLQRFEIFHDVLAPAILYWRRHFLESQLSWSRIADFLSGVGLSVGYSGLGMLLIVLINLTLAFVARAFFWLENWLFNFVSAS
ncbi:MAG: ATP-binding protein [Gammaproteobacteria bacterium]